MSHSASRSQFVLLNSSNWLLHPSCFHCLPLLIIQLLVVFKEGFGLSLFTLFGPPNAHLDAPDSHVQHDGGRVWAGFKQHSLRMSGHWWREGNHQRESTDWTTVGPCVYLAWWLTLQQVVQVEASWAVPLGGWTEKEENKSSECEFRAQSQNCASKLYTISDPKT